MVKICKVKWRTYLIIIIYRRKTKICRTDVACFIVYILGFFFVILFAWACLLMCSMFMCEVMGSFIWHYKLISSVIYIYIYIAFLMSANHHIAGISIDLSLNILPIPWLTLLCKLHKIMLNFGFLYICIFLEF